MRKKFVNDLIITGNGLDLYCGLNTKFSDYINQEMTDYINNEKRTVNIIKDYYNYSKNISDNNWQNYCLLLDKYFVQNKLGRLLDKFNIWEVLLILDDMDNGENWSDIENFMKGFLLKKDDFSNDLFIDYINNTKDVLNNHNIKLSNNNNYVYFILYISINYEYYKENESFWTFLKKQLLKFETDFSMYVSNCVDDLDYTDTSYDERLELILKKISNKNNFNWINFNYYSFSDVYHPEINISNEINIHGASPFVNNDYHAIIGIDSKIDKTKKFNGLNTTDKNNVLYFTKKHRRDEENISLTTKILDKNIKTIKIFGHSLSEADDSYFFEIFDYYNILNKNYIEIYYKPRNNNVDASKNKQIEKVKSLLKRYKTMSFEKITSEDRIKYINIDNLN